jgi:hypothetical chaperone protein
MKKIIGLDFGTTNSAIACATEDGNVELAKFQGDNGFSTTCRSVLYFNEKNKEIDGTPIVSVGHEAIRDYLESETAGRLIQSTKSYLTSRTFTKTSLCNKPYTLEELISTIINRLRKQAENQFGDLGSSIVVGRPVNFSGAKTKEDEDLALDRLKIALEQCGFTDVTFEFEPVAAAYYYEKQLRKDELVLIADFGGGTSDFSLMRLGPFASKKRSRASNILGTDGVAIAGDTFDSRIVRNLVAPHLGFKSFYKSIGKSLEMPYWIYEKLGRWHHVSFLKTRETMNLLRELRGQALEQKKIDALIYLIKEDLGYKLYRSVEQTKVALSKQEKDKFIFKEILPFIEEVVLRESFETWINIDIKAISECVDRLLLKCEILPKNVDSVFLTGGSSFVPAVRKIFQDKFGAERLRGGEELTTVAKGLALRGLDRS